METAAGCVSIDIEPGVPLIFGSGHMALRPTAVCVARSGVTFGRKEVL